MPLRPEVWVVSGDLSQLVLPLGCASCRGATDQARLLTGGPERRELFIPYCSACLARLAQGETNVVSVALASVLLSVALAFAFPALWPHASFATELVVALLVAAAPLFLAIGLAKLGSGGSLAPSVLWTERGELACRDHAFAVELAEQNGLALTRRSELTLGPHRITALTLVFGLLLASVSFFWHHPALRVLNLSGERLWLSIDGRAPTLVEPTSGERVAAGLSLRVALGLRRLVATQRDGATVADVMAVFDARHEHLFAPASDGECFWLESTGYGKERHHRVVPLSSESRFWKLEAHVDTWFVAPPTPSSVDARSTGGTVTALRHAACERAPFAAAESPNGAETHLPALGP